MKGIVESLLRAGADCELTVGLLAPVPFAGEVAVFERSSEDLRRR